MGYPQSYAEKHIRKKAFSGGFLGLSREIHRACMEKLRSKKVSVFCVDRFTKKKIEKKSN